MSMIWWNKKILLKRKTIFSASIEVIWRIELKLYENNSLRIKHNTSLLDCESSKSKIIKVEITQKTPLKDILTQKQDESRMIFGEWDLRSTAGEKDVSKSLLDISMKYQSQEKKRRGHHRHISYMNSEYPSIIEVSSLKQKPLISSKPDPAKDLDVSKKVIKITNKARLPKLASILSIKEGRVFFIGGNIDNKTNSEFVEFLEDCNTLFYHPKMKRVRESLGTCFLENKVYAIGGCEQGKKELCHDSIESIPLPDLPEIDCKENYDEMEVYIPSNSNQDNSFSELDWHEYSETMQSRRSHMSIVTQNERYIYAFWGKISLRDDIQDRYELYQTNTIEKFDTITEKWEEYVLKSWHKISEWFLPNSIAVQSRVNKNPGILFFGGKDKNEGTVLKNNKNILMIFPQNDKWRKLESRYHIKGKQIDFDATDHIEENSKKKISIKNREFKIFNGDLEWLSRSSLYTEDQFYYYFLGCHDEWTKLKAQTDKEPILKDFMDNNFRSSFRHKGHHPFDKDITLKNAK